MSTHPMDDEAAIALRSLQITYTLTEGEREQLFLQAFPGMKPLMDLEPTLVQSLMNKLARIIYRAEQQMGVRYETHDALYLACENATRKLVEDGHRKHGLESPRTGRQIH